MLKIVVISPIYKIVGRNEIFRDSESVHDLIKYWSKNDEVKVFFPYTRGIKSIFNFFNKKNLNYYYSGYSYNCDNIFVTIIDWQKLYPKHLKYKIKNTNRINRIIRSKLKSTPDVIIVHIPSSYQNLQKNKKFNCKKIAVLHYTDVKYLYKKKEKFIKYLNENYDAIFCRSNAIYKIFKNTSLKNLNDKIISSGIPNMNFNNCDIEKKFTTKKIKFLYVGKLIERKNLDILIKSLANFPTDKWELKVIGSGPMYDNYKELVSTLNLDNNVSFIGYLNKDKVYEYMKKSDVFCMPSINETLGLVYLEAMGNGCITIGTKNEGIDGIIKNEENGFLINPNVDELTNVITKLYNYNIEDKKRIMQNALATAEIYREEKMSKKYYTEIMKVVNHDGKKEHK